MCFIFFFTTSVRIIFPFDKYLSSYVRESHRYTCRLLRGVYINISPILTAIGICQYILVELLNIKFHKHTLIGSVVVVCEQTGQQKYFEVNRRIFTTFRCQHVK